MAPLTMTNDDLVETIKNLEARITRLESRPTFEYVGTFDAKKSYAPGHLVTHEGSMWHCQRATSHRPGASRDWKLIVKRGPRGRDGEPAPKN